VFGSHCKLLDFFWASCSSSKDHDSFDFQLDPMQRHDINERTHLHVEIEQLFPTDIRWMTTAKRTLNVGCV